MRREWEPEDVVAHWTLVDDDGRLVANKTGPSRLGFALLLKFFELEARFHRHADELPTAAVEYVAARVKVEAVQLAKYAWSGRTIEYHRAQISDALGFREATRSDELTGADREDQEITMLALHLLQSALVYINTIILQRVLDRPEWADRLTDEDRRALTPLLWTHVNPYGSFNLQMDRHLDLGLPAAAR